MRALGGGYRRAGEASIEPVFDPPRESEGGPLHERPIDGYPHLVVAEDAEALRQSLADRDDVRDALASRGLAVVLGALGEVGWDDLHDRAVGARRVPVTRAQRRCARIARAISAKPAPRSPVATYRGGTLTRSTNAFTFATPNVVANAEKHAASFALSPAKP